MEKRSRVGVQSTALIKSRAPLWEAELRNLAACLCYTRTEPSPALFGLSFLKMCASICRSPCPSKQYGSDLERTVCVCSRHISGCLDDVEQLSQGQSLGWNAHLLKRRIKVWREWERYEERIKTTLYQNDESAKQSVVRYFSTHLSHVLTQNIGPEGVDFLYGSGFNPLFLI